ncbi:hypothetical protein I4F81_000131 [Pyropia yezoensis]|uniref:Uncharacterized protein n=1 Tax=Pyropia yezoensis TaxID=2788 RepID=A0ACC3BIA1_PYRYE|nr:hypothetical protein I4F81_000131 [Neopyropia yezoensis]
MYHPRVAAEVRRLPKARRTAVTAVAALPPVHRRGVLVPLVPLGKRRAARSAFMWPRSVMHRRAVLEQVAPRRKRRVARATHVGAQPQVDGGEVLGQVGALCKGPVALGARVSAGAAAAARRGRGAHRRPAGARRRRRHNRRGRRAPPVRALDHRPRVIDHHPRWWWRGWRQRRGSAQGHPRPSQRHMPRRRAVRAARDAAAGCRRPRRSSGGVEQRNAAVWRLDALEPRRRRHRRADAPVTVAIRKRRPPGGT